jgi:hypothetical protein
MALKETEKEFRLTMTGVPMPLALKGIWTRMLFLSADGSNAEDIFIGNQFEHANAAGLVATLNANNKHTVLSPGKEARITDDQQYSRGTMRRSMFVEDGYTHVMSKWYAQGAAGDVLTVGWIAEINGDGSTPYLDVNQVPVAIEEGDLTR